MEEVAKTRVQECVTHTRGKYSTTEIDMDVRLSLNGFNQSGI